MTNAPQNDVEEIVLAVPAMSCSHCEAAVTSAVGMVAGVTRVDVDLATKLVVVTGRGVVRDAVVAAIDEAGYEAGEP
ncbi:MAG: Heavy metal transporter [Ilumatobacteraceae bacterium]|jgi:copper chaperone|nr:Heavy metal transporter [Ilumatobacteraceae bacterium]